MYFRLGNVLTNLGKKKEAIEKYILIIIKNSNISYKNCLKIDPHEDYLEKEPNS